MYDAYKIWFHKTIFKFMVFSISNIYSCSWYKFFWCTDDRKTSPLNPKILICIDLIKKSWPKIPFSCLQSNIQKLAFDFLLHSQNLNFLIFMHCIMFDLGSSSVPNKFKPHLDNTQVIFWIYSIFTTIHHSQCNQCWWMPL